MGAPVLTPQGLAQVYDRVTGEVRVLHVPNALENVARNPQRYGHGAACPADERIDAPPEPEAPDEPAVALIQGETLPLSDADVETLKSQLTKALDENARLKAKIAKFDRDGDGSPGGSKPSAAPKPASPDADERKAVLAALKARGIKAFGGAPLASLKAKLAEAN